MQNTATNTPTTTTTEQTTATPPTLAALIEDYRARIRQQELVRACKVVARNAEKMDGFIGHVIQWLPDALYDALDLSYRWQGNPFHEWGGYPEAVFTLDGEEWTIDYDREEDWRIHCQHHTGRSIYSKDLGDCLLSLIADHDDSYGPAKRQEGPRRYLDLSGIPMSAASDPDLTDDSIPF